jgi:hypothetical protein
MGKWSAVTTETKTKKKKSDHLPHHIVDQQQIIHQEGLG